jgi:predicted dehydrogenase
MPDASLTSRRNFLKTGTTAAIAGGISSQLTSRLYAQGGDVLKVGLIGVGGRGSGAAVNALSADPHTRLHAVADAFQDRLDSGLENLLNTKIKDQITVDNDHKFVGFDAYKHVIESCDVVLLATPPHFRPMQLRAAVEAGKHAFVEKPVGVDAPGIRSVLETCKLAERKGLSIVSGLCWRYDTEKREVFEQIHAGTIGEITAMQCSYNSGGVWEPRATREQCTSDMEYQMRNWYYYTWLSGDFNTEQHVHSLDKMAWAMHDQTPVSVSGTGGRIQRTDPKYGNIYDHFSVVYEYANGVKAFARCRHFRGCSNEVNDFIFGTKGWVDVMGHKIYDYEKNLIWRYRGPKGNMYQIEHDEFFASIRDGKPINNGDYMSHSSMLAIAGRMSAYTGKTLTWDECMNSQLDLSPPGYEWGPLETRPVAVPGNTPFV